MKPSLAELIAVAAVVALAAIALWRSLRRRGAKAAGCSECPLKEACEKPRNPYRKP